MITKRARGRLAAGAAVVAGLLAGSGPAREAGAETLAEALESAYVGNPGLAASRSRLDAARERLVQARGGYRPDIAIDSGSSYSDVASSQAADRLNTNEAALRVRQSLYAGGGTAAGIRSAQSLVAGEEARLSVDEQQLLFDAVGAYTAVLRDQRILNASQGNVGRLEQQLGATRQRLSVGEATRTDASQAEARLIGAFAERAQAQANLGNSVAAYERVVGARPQTLQTAPLPQGLPAGADDALALAENNPEVVAARARLAQAEADVGSAIARLLPSVDLRGDLSYVDEPSQFTDWERTASVGVEVTIPIYERGVAGSRLREARRIVEQRRRELDDARRLASEGVTGALEDVRAANERVRFFNDQTRAYEQALDGLRQELLVGTRSLTDVLDAEDDLFGAQVSLERAVRDRAVAAYDLKQAIGQLTGADLGLAPLPPPPPARSAGR